MREALFILVILLVLAALTLYRYRRQVGVVVQIWRALRKMRSEHNKSINRRVETSLGPLVNCTRCGTWTPEGKAIRLGGANYCSAKCVETAAHAG